MGCFGSTMVRESSTLRFLRLDLYLSSIRIDTLHKCDESTNYKVKTLVKIMPRIYFRV